jgi:intracellular multiplication protein IcmP
MAAAPQGGNPGDNSAGILWVVAAIFGGLAAVWYTEQAAIVSFYFDIKLFEISLLSHFTNNLEDVRTAILNSDPSKTSMDQMMLIGSAVGYYLRIPCIIFILILAVVVFFGNSVRVFVRTYNMKDLVTLEQDNWPQIVPVAKLDLVKQDIDKGPWAMALTPIPFCKRYNLLEEYKRAPTEGMSRKEINKIEVRLKRGEANKVFAMQLGPLWAGPEKLPPHVKALFAIFCARYQGDPAAVTMLRQLSRTAVTKLDFNGIDQLLKKHGSDKAVVKIMESHAYVMTVMASMLALARLDGVQASADFLWLKPLDRRLWYTLNTVGRQTPFPEVAGIYGHWIAERDMGRKLLVPMVDEATNALETALKEIIYKPDEPA